MLPPLTLVDLASETQGIDFYKNVPLSLVNDHVVRLSIMTEQFYWHYHPNSDETFYVIEGVLCIDLEDRTIEFPKHAGFVVPASQVTEVNHCT